jgi:molecular chaperone GrpE
MSSKKVHSTEPGPQAMPEESSAQAAGAASEAELEAVPSLVELQEQLEKACCQAAEYKDGWQRSVADFQNYRRRVEAEKADTYQMAVGNIIKRYLPVLDDMERAMETRPAELPWADGIELIYRKLQSILEAEGIKRIEAEGQKFDPNFHEAASQEISQGVESGTVIGVIRNGYMLDGRVIRPAMVRVAQ